MIKVRGKRLIPVERLSMGNALSQHPGYSKNPNNASIKWNILKSSRDAYALCSPRCEKPKWLRRPPQTPNVV
jgi:hypothetical protein